MAAQLQTSRACAGPLSEIGEVRDATEDTHSIYGDSDLMSSDGRDQASICRAFVLLPDRPSHELLSNSSSLARDHDMLQAVSSYICCSQATCMPKSGFPCC